MIYVVSVALRLARFNVHTSEEPSWRDNFFEGMPSPAGGIMVLIPLIFSFSEYNLAILNNDLFVPVFFIIISILLISKIPTYSLKKITVPRRASIFLLFGIIFYFGLLLVYPFNTMVISGIIYLATIPISSIHYFKLKDKFKTQSDDIDDHEDIL